MSKLATSKVSVSQCLLFPDPQTTARSIRPDSATETPGMTLWKVSLTDSRFESYNPISMNVCGLSRLRVDLLSISFLAMLYLPIRI
jgi:hypothetical protein